MATVIAVSRRQSGVTLVELMIGIAITLITLGIAVPSFMQWLQSVQVRTAAESIQNGLQLARTEAVRRNVPVRFQLTEDNGEVAWRVGCVMVLADCPGQIQARVAAEGTPNARVGASTAALPSPVPASHFSTALSAGDGVPGGVSFDSLGRVVSANIGTDLTRIDVINAARADARRMVVTISSGGQIRMCDPSLSLASNPAGCS